MFSSSSIKDLNASIVSVTVTATRTLAKMAVFLLLLLRHEMAALWIPTRGPVAIACEKHGARVRKRNETRVFTPSDTTGGFSPIPRGPEDSQLYFLCIIISIQ